jgi:hypothetical protein
MHLSDHSLRQLDDAYVQSLDMAALRDLSLRLLADLQEARERLNQGPTNSSRPPSSQAPWERGGPPVAAPAAAADDEDPAPADVPVADASPTADVPSPGARADVPLAGTLPPAPKRQPGKQLGAPGCGRTQVFTAHATQAHRPTVCAGCGQALPARGAAVAYTGFQSLDLRWDDPATPGLRLWVVDHQYEEVTCACGHQTRALPAQGEVDAMLAKVQLREWRLVGPGLATLIVALSLRFRMSRARIQEFLWTWLGVQLSIGTIHQTLHEAAAALAPAEAELIASIQASALLHADETSWPQQHQLLWLWVFISATTTLYVIAGRGKATVTRLLAGFTGWLMTDGWFSYRGYPQRLRCWAHLLRKAQGLVECYDPAGRAFGRLVLNTLETLMVAIYAAREGPPAHGAPVDLARAQAERLATLRQACLAHLGHRHDKTQALAVELTNDWAAIFQVLSHPELPLTNNTAERALRHWVIARAISHGTRTDVGSRVFALLASVIDTCRQRGHSPWHYLAAAIADRRVGLPLAPLPQAGV